MSRSVSFLYFDGCPNTPPMRDNLEAALKQIDAGLEIEDIDLTGLKPNDPRRGYGSPTVLVDGVDLFGLGRPESHELSCRFYAGGTPDKPILVERLRSALNREMP